MNMKLFAAIIVALLLIQTGPVFGQIPASELPPAGTDTGLEGKYDPENGIAQLIRDKSSEAAASKIFEDEHVLVFMPLPEEEVTVPGHVLVVPKRLGAAGRELYGSVGGSQLNGWTGTCSGGRPGTKTGSFGRCRAPRECI